MTEDIYETFKINFLNCLKAEKSGRKNLLSRCSCALSNTKSNLKKLLLLFGQVMFRNENDYDKELIVNDKNVTESAIKLINDALSGRVNENDFFSQFINLSKTINFFYRVSELYAKIFLIENAYHEVFSSLIFKKKYQKDKTDYINSISILISGVNKEKYKYEELLDYINKNYNNEKDFISEYIKLFLDDKMNYIDKINEKIKINPKDNKLDLKKIINKNIKSLNEIDISTINDKPNDNNDLGDNHNLNNDSDNNKDKKNTAENINIIDNLNTINNQNIKELSSIQESKDNLNNISNSPPYENNNNIIEEIVTHINNNTMNKYENVDIKLTEEKQLNEEQKEKSTEITEKAPNSELKNNLKTVKNYLTEEYNKYINNQFKVICLEKVLTENTDFTKNDISYVYKMKRNFDPINKINDKILGELLEKLKLDCPVPDISKYGYFSYLNNNCKESEALYSVIDSEIMYYEITKLNKIADDFYNEDDVKRSLYLKSRAKSLEYFINKTVFEKKYKTKQLPRIIFPLQWINKKDGKYEYKKYHYENELEIDGCFFVKEQFKLLDGEFPFESQFFKSSFNDIYSEWTDYENGTTFLEGDVCLLEIKANLPNYIDTYENSFKGEVNNFLSKMIIFEQLLKSIGIEYKRIRLILFYDVVNKCNYQMYLSKILSNFAKRKKYIDYMDKIYFQVIYMDAGYFASSLKKFEDEIDILKYQLNDINKNYQEINKKYEGVQEILKKQEKMFQLLYEGMDEQTKKLYNEIKNGN
jgi:hypothetical protein